MIKNFSIAIYTTTRCNFQCPHCIRRLFDRNKSFIKDLPIKVFEEVLKEAKAIGYSLISLTGGEPILHPEFGKFIELCGQYHYNFTIVSNGSFFEKYWFFLEKYLDNLSFISLSLDGSKPEIHDRQRNQNGSFENVMRAFEFYQKKGFHRLGAVTCLTKYNKKDILSIINLCRKIGIKRLKFLQPNFICEEDDYYLSDVESRELIRQIKKAAQDFWPEIKIRIGSHQHLINAYQPNFCSVLDNPHFSVDPEGGLTFCCDIYKIAEERPNILKDGFKKSISSNLAIIEEIKKERAFNLERNKRALPNEFYNCEYCNNHFAEVISKLSN